MEQGNIGKEEFIRVGTTLYKLVNQPCLNGGYVRKRIVWNNETLRQDYGKHYLAIVPKYDGFCTVPNHVNYRPVVDKFLNLYEPIDHQPQKGDFSHIQSLVRHIFGEQYELGMDYLQLLYLQPIQKLPILLLVSEERNTGKSTFLNFLKALFQNNVTFNTNEDFRSQFNSDWAGKLLIVVDEVLLSRKEDSERLKNLSTTLSYKVEAKGKDRDEIAFFAKFVLCSNNEYLPVIIDAGETRYWVRKIDRLQSDDTEFLQKLKAEIPAFLYHLQHRKLSTKKESRMWFAPGTGMTEEEQQRVFGAFERLSNAAAKDGFGLGLSIVQCIVTMLGGIIRLESDKGKGSRFTVEIPMQTVEELPEQINQTQIHCNHVFHNVIAIDNDEVLLLMLKEMYVQEGIHCDTCTNAAELMEMIRRKEYSLLLTDLNMPDINGFELLELLRTSNVGNSRTIPIIVTTASGSCSKEELMERGFADCLLKPFSISELMEVSDKCAMNVAQNEKPDFTSLLSYGNESVMLEKLITETEKEIQVVKDAERRKDLQGLDALIHHLRSSWEILRADQPLRELYKLLHCKDTPDWEAIHNILTVVQDKGLEIIRLAKEERKKYNNG